MVLSFFSSSLRACDWSQILPIAVRDIPKRVIALANECTVVYIYELVIGRRLGQLRLVTFVNM